MKIILLEKIRKLGNIGDIVEVKAGFARNFLLPNEMALRPSTENLAIVERDKEKLEAKNIAMLKDASLIAEILNGKTIKVVRTASESGHLYGSVSALDIANTLNDKFTTSIQKRQVVMEKAIKSTGNYNIRIDLHPDVISEITLNINSPGENSNIHLGEKINKDDKKPVEKKVSKTKTKPSDDATQTSKDSSAE